MAISLEKGQKISLEKTAGSALTTIRMGLGWDVMKSKGFLGFGGGTADIDLDASCLMFDEQNEPVDAIYFAQLTSKDGSIRHSGDNRTGAGDGDDESITVDLNKVPARVKSLMFTVNSFQGQTFDKVENAYCRIINAQGNSEIAKFNLSCQGSHTALIVAKLYRHGGEWKMHAIGETAVGRTFHDLMPRMIAAL
jgi:tellurium resistance protein TerZ